MLKPQFICAMHRLKIRAISFVKFPSVQRLSFLKTPGTFYKIRWNGKVGYSKAEYLR